VIESILTSVKKNLGIDENYTVFDADILMYINSTLSTLTQLGVGPEDGFIVEDDTATWDQLLEGDKRLNFVRSYVTLQVKMLFDPPTTSFTIEAINEQIAEFIYRISVVREGDVWEAQQAVLPAP
jgi:hypothetical protein